MTQTTNFTIGFDAKRALLNGTGLGNYSRSVITSLAEAYPQCEMRLYTTKAPRNTMTNALWQYKNIQIVTPKLPFLRSLWRSKLVVRQMLMDKVDLYHGLSHEIPMGIQRTGIKTVVTIHDLIFLRFPEYYNPIDRKIYTLKFKNACIYADRIIATSEQTKRDIIFFFGIKPEKIEVVYQSCHPQFYQHFNEESDRQLLEKYKLPAHYILNVGTIEVRKNLVVLVKALANTPDKYKLVVIGKPTDYKNEVDAAIKQLNLQNRVLFLQDVQQQDLPAIYRCASVFVYPSVFEGFGIPIVEALHSGVPVIAATGSCLEEAGGSSSLYFEPSNVTALTEKINQVLSNEQLRQTMIDKGFQYAANFTEGLHATQLMAIYQRMMIDA